MRCFMKNGSWARFHPGDISTPDWDPDPGKVDLARWLRAQDTMMCMVGYICSKYYFSINQTQNMTGFKSSLQALKITIIAKDISTIP